VPQDKVEIVERFFEARSRGDLSYLNYVDSDAEFDLLDGLRIAIPLALFASSWCL
jgi:hypothetical protein